MADTQPSRKTRFVAASLLWGFWAVSALPLFALYFEFQCRQLGECEAEWWYYARFYSHFFLYPVTFGLISIVLLHRPWVRSFHHFLSMKLRTRIFIVLTTLAVVCLASFEEFFRATPAPWDIAPAVMKDRDEGKRILFLVGKRCEMVSESHALPSLDKEDKREYQEQLNRLWNDGNEHRSRTLYFYRAGFVSMTILFSFLGATVAITVIRNMKNREDSENRRMMPLVMFALISASFWVVMRFTFIMEKMTIYSEDPLLKFNWLIFLVFAFFYVPLAVTIWPRSGIYDRFLSIVPGIAGILITGMAAMESEDGSRFMEWIPGTLVGVFGTGSSPGTYLATFLLLLAIFFPYILRLLEEDPKADDPDRLGIP